MKIHEPSSTNPRGKIVNFFFLVETQLKITNIVLQQHTKQIQEENQNSINCLEKIQRRQRKSLEKLNTVLRIRKEVRKEIEQIKLEQRNLKETLEKVNQKVDKILEQRKTG